MNSNYICVFEMCWKQQQQSAKKRKYGHSYADGVRRGRTGWRHVARSGPYGHPYADGNAVGVCHLPGAQEAATWRSEADGNAVGVC